MKHDALIRGRLGVKAVPGWLLTWLALIPSWCRGLLPELDPLPITRVARLLGSGEFPMDSSLSAGQGPELPGGAVGMMGIRVTSTALLTGRFHGFAHWALAVEISR